MSNRQKHLLEALVPAVVELALDVVATCAGWKLRYALHGVGPLATAQVVRLARVQEVLLHVCGHLHFAECLVDKWGNYWICVTVI